MIQASFGKRSKSFHTTCIKTNRSDKQFRYFSEDFNSRSLDAALGEDTLVRISLKSGQLHLIHQL